MERKHKHTNYQSEELRVGRWCPPNTFRNINPKIERIWVEFENLRTRKLNRPLIDEFHKVVSFGKGQTGRDSPKELLGNELPIDYRYYKEKKYETNIKRDDA